MSMIFCGIAYVLRVIAIPPVTTTVLILLVWFNDQAITSVRELIASFALLVVVPVAAYPVSYMIPKIRKGGRKAQRSLAFWFAGFGYTAAVVYGMACHKSQGLNFIYIRKAPEARRENCFRSTMESLRSRKRQTFLLLSQQFMAPRR